MYYLPFLDEVHQRLRPRAYLEVGVAQGRSLRLARCRAVGVDPAFKIEYELDNDVALVRSTSDEYFNRLDPLTLSRGQTFDLSFLDGLHLLEFALRDFIYAERYSSPRGVIIFDDVLPRSVDEAARNRYTIDWTGDVYSMPQVLARFRPDLIVVPVSTQPTGLLIVLGLDSESTVLADRYEEILAEFRKPDPQPVPIEILDRLTVHPPRRFLDSGVLDHIADTATAPAGHEDLGAFRSRLRDLVSRSLGKGYALSSNRAD